MIKLKIEQDTNVVKYVTLIRKYDKNLSIGEIKKRIETASYIIEHDVYDWDICDDMDGVDRNQLFRNLILELLENGATLYIYDEDEEMTLEQLDNYFETVCLIESQTNLDMEREG